MLVDHLKKPSLPIFKKISTLVDIAYIPFLSIFGGIVLTITIIKGYYIVLITISLLYISSYLFRKFVLSKFRNITFNLAVELFYILILSLLGGALVYLRPFIWLNSYMPNHMDISEYILNFAAMDNIPIFPAIYFTYILVIALFVAIPSALMKIFQLKDVPVIHLEVYFGIAGFILAYALSQFIDLQEFFKDNVGFATLLVGSPIPYSLLLTFGIYKSPILESLEKEHEKNELIYRRLESR